MLDLELSPSLLLSILPLLVLLYVYLHSKSPTNTPSSKSRNLYLPKSYPLIGNLFDIFKNRNQLMQWTADVLENSPTQTFTFHGPLGQRSVLTANPANVEHMLKTRFNNYQKGENFRELFSDVFGNGTFISDGEKWKSERQILSIEFTSKAFSKFAEQVFCNELANRVIPILSTAAANRTTVDLQDIFERLGVDTICQMAFGYDVQALLLSLPENEFGQAFHQSLQICIQRLSSVFTWTWKTRRFLNIGGEKKLRVLVKKMRDTVKEVINERKMELQKNMATQSFDILTLLLKPGDLDDSFLTDMVINFILAGLDTSSAGLTWFFWLLSVNPEVEREILKEIKEQNADSGAPEYEKVKNMVYTHAALCEGLRFYPPVPMDNKEAAEDDIMPDGTEVKKGTRVTYHIYGMGRSERLWGPDWAEFKPERWLKRDEVTGTWVFTGRDSCTYSVFNAGPRICLGKELAFLQMKTAVAAILGKFRVVPAFEKGMGPNMISYITLKMRGGFPVRIEQRVNKS